jgi:ribosomal protein S18 acetylase RimI-like enzyme
MPLPEHVLRFWRAMDSCFGSVRPTSWGAVVTDARFPAIWDANYGRVDVPTSGLAPDEVVPVVRDAVAGIGADLLHLVCFAPDPDDGLLPALVSRGHRLSWDAVLELAAADPADPASAPVEELAPDRELFARVRASFELFGVEGEPARTQLGRIEEQVLTPAGKRWFGVRDGGRIEALGALVVLEGVGYIDNIATFPAARGRGYAGAVTARIAREARAAGVDHVFLIADPGEPAVLRLYGRLGFREIGRIASTKGPLGDGDRTAPGLRERQVNG